MSLQLSFQVTTHISTFSSSDNLLKIQLLRILRLFKILRILRQWKKEQSERLRGERDQIKFIDLGYGRWRVERFRKARGRRDVP